MILEKAGLPCGIDPERIDLHMHTTVSDGSDRPEELLEKVRRSGLTLFSVTDHDAVAACDFIRAALREGDPRFLSGVEFSCRDLGGKYHILGYGFREDRQEVRLLAHKAHELRMKKALVRLEFLKDEFGFVFPQEDIDAFLSLSNPGKPHLALMMVRYGYAPDKETAISEYIDKKKLNNVYLNPQETIRAIRDGGGVAILAHPTLGSGTQDIRGRRLRFRLNHLKRYGLQGIEAFYATFDAATSLELLALAKEHDFYVTAGSDYHGTNKKQGIGDTGLNAVTCTAPGLLRFIQDMCM